MERQGGKLESDDCDATGPRPIWTSTCVLDDSGRSKAWCNAWLQWQCRLGTTHRSMSWPTREQILSERQLDQSLSLLPSPKNQHRRHSRSQRLHHPVLLRRCQGKTFRTSRWIHQWSWEHKNAESAKERGQARRQQVKSLEDQWSKARPASSPMIVPTAEGSGTVVLSTPASSSKDEMTIGGLYVIDGIHVAVRGNRNVHH